MADIYLTCEGCNGQRFKQDVLEVKYQDKDISRCAGHDRGRQHGFLCRPVPIINKLLPLQDVGLGYITLGQSSNTLSGGEAQRVKLAAFLAKGANSTNQNISSLFSMNPPPVCTSTTSANC